MNGKLIVAAIASIVLVSGAAIWFDSPPDAQEITLISLIVLVAIIVGGNWLRNHKRRKSNENK